MKTGHQIKEDVARLAGDIDKLVHYVMLTRNIAWDSAMRDKRNIEVMKASMEKLLS